MASEAGPRREIAIHILDDGRVVFGDLPPDLAEVAAIVAGAPAVEAASPPAQPPSPNPPELK